LISGQAAAVLRRRNSARRVLTTRRSDFRIIAASNRDLAKEVEKTATRRDLCFQLNVINIRLALRERKEDIPR
jgi:DNA-binding NtrC family response regulator